MKRFAAFLLALLHAAAAPGQTVNSISFGDTGLTPADAGWGGVEVSGTLAPTHGGTGLAAYVAGDLLYATGTTALSRLAIGTNTYVLTSSGGLPTWMPTASGSGSVTSVSVVSANGFAGTVANATTTPAITLRTTITGLLSGNGTAVSAASTTGSGSVVLASSDATTVNGQTCTLGSTCTITAAASGVTVGTTTVGGGSTGRLLYDNAGVLGEMTTSGSGTVVALATGPTIAGLTVTGSFAATGLVANTDLVNAATTVNGQTCTLGSTCTVAAAAGTLTGATLAAGVTASSLTSVGTLAGLTVTGSFTATGLVTNADLANAATTVNGQTCTLGSTCTVTVPVATGISGLGTGIATALAVNVGSAGAPVLFNGAGGTPSSLTLTSATGLPIGGLTGLGTGVGTALGVNVGSAGAFVVFGGALGTPSGGTLTNATGLPVGGIAAMATNTVAGNATSGSASPTALAVGTCSTAASALIWTTNTGFGCNTSITAAVVPASGLTGTTLAAGVVTSSLTTVGTIGTGVWNGTAVIGTYGGTGVNNGTKTITLGGNLTTSGAFNTTLTVTADTNVTLPTTGTLVNSAVASLSSLVTVGTLTGGATGAGFTIALGSSTITGDLPFANLTQGAANTVLANATSGTADFAAFSMSSCSTAGSALIWTTNTGFGCNSSITAAAVPASGLTGTTLASNVVTTSVTTLGVNAQAQIMSVVGSGNTNAFTCGPSPAWTSYVKGQSLLCQINNTQNNTTPTLNVSGLGTKTIVKRAATAVASGDMLSGGYYLFVYDGTNMQVLNPTVN